MKVIAIFQKYMFTRSLHYFIITFLYNLYYKYGFFFIKSVLKCVILNKINIL